MTASIGPTKCFIHDPHQSNPDQILLPWGSLNVKEHFTFLIYQKWELDTRFVWITKSFAALAPPLRCRPGGAQGCDGARLMDSWSEVMMMVASPKVTSWHMMMGWGSWEVRACGVRTCSVSDPPQLSPFLGGPPLRTAPGPLWQTKRTF